MNTNQERNTFECLCCKKIIDMDAPDYDDCYDMCDVNGKIHGSICESCFETYSDNELFILTGLIPCDTYSDELVEKLQKRFPPTVLKHKGVTA